MGHRLSRIVTRTGDQGQTRLGSGTRVDKDSPPIEAMGTIDELNCWIGVLFMLAKSPEVKQSLEFVQHDLFDLGAQISVPGTPWLSQDHLTRIEGSFNQVNDGLSMLKEFILPGGEPASSFAHVARTVCRRAERRLFSLSETDLQFEIQGGRKASGQNYGLSYLNRLSEFLFVAARVENHAAGCADVLWERGKSIQVEKSRGS
ncbi:MAG: cob(I)yrinic acid a,c-diamide adenosyltransferase [Aestuariivirga sp.]|nr:cob(I)yrinic acid a,c-diamide adenosyltransferase [Aestuariivirga sp.]